MFFCRSPPGACGGKSRSSCSCSRRGAVPTYPETAWTYQTQRGRVKHAHSASRPRHLCRRLVRFSWSCYSGCSCCPPGVPSEPVAFLAVGRVDGRLLLLVCVLFSCVCACRRVAPCGPWPAGRFFGRATRHTRGVLNCTRRVDSGLPVLGASQGTPPATGLAPGGSGHRNWNQQRRPLNKPEQNKKTRAGI